MEAYRFNPEGAVYFITFSVVEWLPVFVSEHTCGIISESFRHCHHNMGLRINAYVIMPTHLHAILFDERFDAKRLEKSILAFRKFTGRQLCDYCADHRPACFSERLRAAAGPDRERRFSSAGYWGEERNGTAEVPLSALDW